MTEAMTPISEDMVELKGCPFCGGKAGFCEFGTTIVCDNDDCPVSAYVSLGQTEDAASAWNTRAALEGSVAVPVEAFEDLHSHYAAWRVAICRLAVTSCGDDETYWEHELKAFERTFAALPRQDRGGAA